jgi:hypothetical protein
MPISHRMNNEKFDSANYPNAMSELSALKRGISETPIYFKVEIIISFLKNHSLEVTWIDANPSLARMITSGFFKTSNLESIFDSGRNNSGFLNDYEEYIRKQLLKMN